MPSLRTITGIDIGNAYVKTVVAEVARDSFDSKNRPSGGIVPKILGTGISFSSGLRKGMIIDMDEAVDNVRKSVQQAQAMAGIKIKKAYVSISGLHVRSQISKGVVAVSRADGEISQSDIDRVIEAASVVSLPANREKIHVIPRNFIIDGQEYIKNPLGMKGVRIEADVLIIDGLSPYIHNLAKCVNENNIEVVEFVFTPMAASRAVLSKNQKEHGVLSLDFGGGTSSVSLFHEGDLVHMAILPVGSRHITNDLAVSLRTTMEVAESIKMEYGRLNQDKNEEKNKVDLSSLIGEEDFIVPQKEIIGVINARVGELFDMVRTEIKKASYIKNIPAGLVISGGGANLPGLAAFAKDYLNLPVRTSTFPQFEGVLNQVYDPSFAVAVGLVMWGIERESGSLSGISDFLDNFGMFKKIGDWFKNFLP